MIRAAKVLRRASPFAGAAALAITACGGTDTSGLFDAAGQSGGAAVPTSGASGAAHGGSAGTPLGGNAGAHSGGATLGGSSGGRPVAGTGGGVSAEAGSSSGGEPTEPGGDAGGPQGGTQGNGARGGGDQGGSTPSPSGGSSAGGGNGCEEAAELCDGLDNDCDGDADEGADCPRGCSGVAREGRGYLFCLETERTFEGALTTCARADMHLAWIESARENALIVSLAKEMQTGATRMWIGGADVEEEGDWRWLDSDGSGHAAFWSGARPEDGGAPVDDNYVNWGEERPNGDPQSNSEDCLNMTLDREELTEGTWNDGDCEASWPFVCEPGP